MDDAIEKTRAVIDQVQVVKKGLMQELLTRGLPGRHKKLKKTEIGEVPEEWEVESVGDVGLWFSGGTPSKNKPEYWSGRIPWVSPKDMKAARITGVLDHVSREAIGNGTRLIPAGTLPLVVRGMILAHTFPVGLTMREVAFDQDVKAVLPHDVFDPEFLLYWFQSQAQRFLNLIDTATHGTKRLPTPKLFAVPLPRPALDEQKHIAALLRSLDEYDEATRRSLEEHTMVKQSLMSVLLTGEVRVKPDSEAA